MNNKKKVNEKDFKKTHIKRHAFFDFDDQKYPHVYGNKDDSSQ
jgi:hypothetical protein